MQKLMIGILGQWRRRKAEVGSVVGDFGIPTLFNLKHNKVVWVFTSVIGG
jgi:hypothetical protein